MTASRASAPPAGVASASAVSRRVAVGLAAAGLAIVFSSGLTTSAWSSFPDPALGGDLLVFALLGAAFFPATTPPAALCAATLVAVQAALLASFLGTTEGKLLFTDDHSTFFYRLHILAARFPDLTYYDPGWNAGRLTTEVFPTGAILLYLVAAPFLAVWPLETAYNAVVGVTLFGVCPLLVVAAASLLGFDRRSRWVAGLLSLMPSLMVARWALKYGAVPFVLVSYASMLVYALARRLAIADRGAWPIGVGLALLLSAALLWSGAVFLLAPVGAAAFLDPRATGRGRLRLIALVVIVAAANAWWMLEYVRHVPVFDFVSKADALNEAPLVTKGEIGFGRSLEATWAILQKTSPILLALAPLALLERERRPIVLRLLGLALVFLVIAVLGPQVKRHLELDRMALAMALCLALTGSSALRVLWRAGTSSSQAIAGPLD